MDALSLVATERLAAVGAKEETTRDRLCRVFAGCADSLYRFIVVRVGGDREAADDLVQQTCLEAANQRRIPDDDRECEAWCFGISRNLIRRHWRQRRRRGGNVPLESPRVGAALVRAMESAVMPIDDLAAEESATQLMLAITALPSGDQQLVFDVYFHGRSREDAAAGMGLSAKAVEARLYRIRNRLRALLGGQERDEV